MGYLKIFLVSIIGLVFTFSLELNAQILDPVKWEVKATKLEEATYTLEFKAIIEAGWHIYSQIEPTTEDIGPIPTSFSYETTNGQYTVIGKTSEPAGIEKHDEQFDMQVKYFEDEAVFIQKIKVLNKELKEVKASLEYMACNDMRCLPPEPVSFVVPLNAQKVNETMLGADSLSEFDLLESKKLKLNFKSGREYLTSTKTAKGYFTIFFLGFLGGLIALLTPCVFPMIPLTVSFFTKKDKSSTKGKFNAILYGLFIFGIYILLSIPFHVLDSLDPEILNNISTNFTLNIIFFVIFVIFSLSFFGYFELTLPASWSNSMDDKANKIGGVVGVFFMALTLAIVSFSCTGPILGSLLGGALTSDGGAMQLSVGMGGFGLALALPFALFALFPDWLNSLPKSGGWLNSVKVILGFLELGLAFKFLSNADLVMHLGFLKREIFIGIWVLLGIGLALYLFGIIRFPHDSPIKNLPKWRIGLGGITVLFVLYLLPGLTNTNYANLKLLSGFPPPLFYSLYQQEGSHGMEGLETYTDLASGMAAAKKQNKPVMLDFTGWACVNCRKMEEQVWSEPTIHAMLAKEFVIVSLYVDDRKELPESARFNFKKTTGGVKTIKTIGDKWATLQTINFQNNSQPYYVLLDHQYNILNTPIGYTPDVGTFKSWLVKGKNKIVN